MSRGGRGRAVRGRPPCMKRAAFPVICLGALLFLLAAMGTALGAEGGDVYDPISISASCAPKSISGPQEVTVTITVTNHADADFDVPIALTGPDRTALSLPNGITTLAQKQMVTYTGKWSVSADDLAAGKIIYYLSYQRLGEAANYTRPIAIPITKVTAAAKLTGASLIDT